MGTRSIWSACIGLAVLSSQASAYSSQTSSSNMLLFGTADASIEYAKGSQSVVKMREGEGAASRFGMLGSEDLGGGLKAIMTLEAGFNIDTGTEFFGNGTLFGRQAFVGLSNGWGEVRFGRQYSPAFYALLKLDPFSLNGQNSPFNIFSSVSSQGTGYVPYTSRFNNAVQYLSQDLGPFSFAAFAAPGEVPGATSTGLSFGANVIYETEKALLFYAYLGQRGGAAVDSALFNNHFVGGSYRFGPVRLGGVFEMASSKFKNTNAARGYGLTFSWDVTTNDVFKAAATKRHVIGASDSPLFVTVGWDHSLSKRTTLYTRLVFVDNSAGGSTTLNAIPIDPKSGASGRSINFGITHRF
ncbi:Outer membrane porin protein 32 [Cupriavidus yeoncheonensis]|uniref:Outer membrane porin protein 32 n=1 Tax=Cupriavidus yeoncheonensis TaxID=1462994 RepID=A0A916IS92_9BURK|nr:porin [Cupriavidus yeoncheonensis]CAG2137148.1 Outer membrane porin protein 32 [Cupriavidus yeoncheonensis]